jgi:hypothetical protein
MEFIKFEGLSAAKLVRTWRKMNPGRSEQLSSLTEVSSFGAKYRCGK